MRAPCGAECPVCTAAAAGPAAQGQARWKGGIGLGASLRRATPPPGPCTSELFWALSGRMCCRLFRSVTCAVCFTTALWHFRTACRSQEHMDVETQNYISNPPDPKEAWPPEHSVGSSSKSRAAASPKLWSRRMWCGAACGRMSCPRCTPGCSHYVLAFYAVALVENVLTSCLRCSTPTLRRNKLPRVGVPVSAVPLTARRVCSSVR